jgi:hypothetical protein
MYGFRTASGATARDHCHRPERELLDCPQHVGTVTDATRLAPRVDGEQRVIYIANHWCNRPDPYAHTFTGQSTWILSASILSESVGVHDLGQGYRRPRY